LDDFKKKLMVRQLLIVVGFLGACCAFLFSRNYVKAVSGSENWQAFIEGFQVGIIIVLFGALLFFFIRNIFATRDPERLKKLYVYETDERRQFIQQQAGSIGMNIVMYGLTAGTVVAGNINNTVFLTLLGVCLFVSLVRGYLKLYYKNKF